MRLDLAGGWADAAAYSEAGGGATLVAAISPYASGSIARPEGEGMLGTLRGDRRYVSYSLDVPPDAGLGVEAAEIVLWTTLVKTTIANVSDRREIARISWEVGKLLGILGGGQDEYASALGGIHYLTFGENVGVEKVTLDPALSEAFRRRLILAYTGRSRDAAAIRRCVWQRYAEGNKQVAAALARLSALAAEMRQGLASGDLIAIEEQTEEQWRNQQILDVSVATSEMRSAIELSRRVGGLAGKAVGAGGGGCILIVTADGAAPRVSDVLRRHKLEIIDFHFDTYGVFLEKG